MSVTLKKHMPSWKSAIGLNMTVLASIIFSAI